MALAVAPVWEGEGVLAVVPVSEGGTVVGLGRV